MTTRALIRCLTALLLAGILAWIALSPTTLNCGLVVQGGKMTVPTQPKLPEPWKVTP